MATPEEATNENTLNEPTHTQRIEALKETLDKIVIDLDPSYNENEDADKYRELYIAILESTLVELNELDEDFD